jgi:hypothetical protein
MDFKICTISSLLFSSLLFSLRFFAFFAVQKPSDPSIPQILFSLRISAVQLSLCG